MTAALPTGQLPHAHLNCQWTNFPHFPSRWQTPLTSRKHFGNLCSIPASTIVRKPQSRQLSVVFVTREPARQGIRNRIFWLTTSDLFRIAVVYSAGRGMQQG